MRFIYTKTFAFLIGCLVFVALLVLLQVKGFIFPIRNLFLQAPRPVVAVVRGVTMPVKNFFGTLYRLKDIVKENTALHGEVVGLRQQLAEAQSIKRENDALRSELGFVRKGQYNLEPCTVIAQNPLGLTDTLVLNCGTEKGVAEGQAVLSQGYLVGKIIYAGQGSATALLITNSRFSTDAKLSESGADGVVRGSFGSGLYLDQVSQNTDVQKGALVVTAGINEKIPKNILIGQVSDLVSNSNDLFKKAALSSPIDFENLDYVFVAH